MNKLVISILLIFSVLTSYSQTEVRPNNAPRGIKNKRDEEGNKQETWRAYNYDGDLMSEIEYKNNKIEGKCITYYGGGGPKGLKIKESAQYFDGKKDGPYQRNYLSGQSAVEGEYSLNKKNGHWTAYYEDGQIKSEGEYIQNNRDGIWKTYTRKGVESSSIVYKNGVNVAEAEKAQQANELKKIEKEKADKAKKSAATKK
jgi:antitoxin component YwqK of YwqJK toxin-antitoxin module